VVDSHTGPEIKQKGHYGKRSVTKDPLLEQVNHFSMQNMVNGFNVNKEKQTNQILRLKLETFNKFDVQLDHQITILYI
jgi:hypothetical protein